MIDWRTREPRTSVKNVGSCIRLPKGGRLKAQAERHKYISKQPHVAANGMLAVVSCRLIHGLRRWCAPSASPTQPGTWFYEGCTQACHRPAPTAAALLRTDSGYRFVLLAATVPATADPPTLGELHEAP